MLKEDWNQLLVQEDATIKQHAKCFWLKDRNCNTKFFHSQIKGTRRMNRISRFKDFASMWLEDEQDSNSHILHYFRLIFAGGSADCAQVLELVQNLISREDNDLLCAPFSNEEFRSALFQMHLDKALGLDGLNPAFY